MHMHMVLGLILHTTLLAIVGYALLWSAAKAEGFVALLGRLLGLWVLLLAILSVVGAIAIHMSGGKLLGMDMHDNDHGPGMHRWGPPDGMGPPPPTGMQPPPALPNPPPHH
ncbi:MAG TPA: hypothetical protein VHZ78_14830 [Rhizomicrobium sp.]|jgi:hypothetical protein|nr:hypothetical protein [Rhizomicrobium sp.]